MRMRQCASEMSRVMMGSSSSCSMSSFALILVLALALESCRIISASTSPAQPGGDSRLPLHSYRLLTSLATQQQQQRQQPDSAVPAPEPTPADFGKSRKVREISRGAGEGDELGSAADYRQQQQQQRTVADSSKLKSLYPSLSGSGELLRLFRPLALSPEKTIGMGRWYIPGFGYFSRGGRAASSNFIRFGRSGIPEEVGAVGGGDDVTMLSRNNAKKKNNFIRLGRENPRQTNFIRLGRSGGGGGASLSSGNPEFYSGGYITPPLSDPFRDDEDGRQEFN